MVKQKYVYIWGNFFLLGQALAQQSARVMSICQASGGLTVGEGSDKNIHCDINP